MRELISSSTVGKSRKLPPPVRQSSSQVRPFDHEGPRTSQKTLQKVYGFRPGAFNSKKRSGADAVLRDAAIRP